MFPNQQQNLRKQLGSDHSLGSASSAEMWDVCFNEKSFGDPEKEA